MKKKQKEIFLRNEGDAYFNRNYLKKRKIITKDPIIYALTNFIDKKSIKKKMNLLEIGCGEGERLVWISKNLNLKCYGIDPSKRAIEVAKKNNILAKIGTADHLKFTDKKFDIVIFGFCAYLFDPEDYFKIAYEADRVLKESGYIIIRDFFSKNLIKKKYVHNKDIKTHKMDFKKLFEWHPYYQPIFHLIESKTKIDNEDDLMATSILRKNHR